MNILQSATCLAACALTACASLQTPTSKMLPNNFDPPAKGVTETIILDGIWGWHTRWESLRRRIEKEVGPCRIWRYNNMGGASLETVGGELSRELASLRAPFNLIGYSMGGLVVREAIRQDPSLPLRRVVTLNSPHGGSVVAKLVPLAACRDMRPGSTFMKRLNDAPWAYPTLAVWCPGDLMVLPGSSARWHRATEVIRCDVPAHEWPVVSGGIHRSVITFLGQD